jgi:hypothetical protein
MWGKQGADADEVPVGGDDNDKTDDDEDDDEEDDEEEQEEEGEEEDAKENDFIRAWRASAACLCSASLANVHIDVTQFTTARTPMQ